PAYPLGPREPPVAAGQDCTSSQFLEAALLRMASRINIMSIDSCGVAPVQYASPSRSRRANDSVCSRKPLPSGTGAGSNAAVLTRPLLICSTAGPLIGG